MIRIKITILWIKIAKSNDKKFVNNKNLLQLAALKIINDSIYRVNWDKNEKKNQQTT